MKRRNRYQDVEKAYDRAREKAETDELLDEEYQAGSFAPAAELAALLESGRDDDDAAAAASLVALMQPDG